MRNNRMIENNLARIAGTTKILKISIIEEIRYLKSLGDIISPREFRILEQMEHAKKAILEAQTICEEGLINDHLL